MPGLPGPGSRHGIYVYQDGDWRLLRSEGGAFTLGELGDGVYLVYFDNAYCPACRAQDPHFEEIVRWYKGRAKFVVVLCNWFEEDCRSEAAAATFRKFQVKSSPTIVVARVEGGKAVKVETLQGVRPAPVLRIYLDSALKG